MRDLLQTPIDVEKVVKYIAKQYKKHNIVDDPEVERLLYDPESFGIEDKYDIALLKALWIQHYFMEDDMPGFDGMSLDEWASQTMGGLLEEPKVFYIGHLLPPKTSELSDEHLAILKDIMKVCN